MRDLTAWNSARVAAALASLGYAPFGQLDRTTPENPGFVLLAALSARDLEVRVLEGLPWLAYQFHDLDWEWLIREIEQRELQNRLGFIVTLAREMAEQLGANQPATRLREIEERLERVRLAREDTLCQASMPEAERRWLRDNRPPEAAHWNLITD